MGFSDVPDLILLAIEKILLSGMSVCHIITGEGKEVLRDIAHGSARKEIEVFGTGFNMEISLLRKIFAHILIGILSGKSRCELSSRDYDELMLKTFGKVSNYENDFLDLDFKSVVCFCDDYFDSAHHRFDSVQKWPWDVADFKIESIVNAYSKGEMLNDLDILRFYRKYY